METGHGGAQDQHAASVGEGGELLHDHGVRAGRELRAGEDARGQTRADRRAGRASRARGPDERQRARRAPGRVLGAQGVAVHRRVIEGREILAREERLGGDAPAGVLGRDHLGAQRRRTGEDETQGLVG